MKIAQIAAVMTSFALFAGCNPGGGSDDSLSDMLDDYETEIEAQVEIFCDCWNEFGFETKSQCMGENSLLPAQRRCVLEALEEEPDAASDWLDCLVSVNAEYTDCIGSRLTCESFDSIEACGDDYELAYGECIGLPASVERDLENCF